jgi:hypothetical protein
MNARQGRAIVSAAIKRSASNAYVLCARLYPALLVQSKALRADSDLRECVFGAVSNIFPKTECPSVLQPLLIRLEHTGKTSGCEP